MNGFSIRLVILLGMLPLILPAQTNIHGHRGCRGVMPENTIEGFLKAIEDGATTLEMDVVISGDGQVIVSHEAYMSAEICLTPSGDMISKKEEKNHNIFKMDVTTIQSYDCGSKPHPRFSEQQKLKAKKPLLEEVFKTVEKHISSKGYNPVQYNIELKCKPSTDNTFHPEPEVFVKLVMDIISRNNIPERVIIQCFDKRVLQLMHDRYPGVRIALLVDNIRGVAFNLRQLGFTPDIYSPYYMLLSAGAINKLHSMGMKVIPWTVNDEKTMKKLLANGVDGIITDYPAKLKQVVDEGL